MSKGSRNFWFLAGCVQVSLLLLFILKWNRWDQSNSAIKNRLAETIQERNWLWEKVLGIKTLSLSQVGKVLEFPSSLQLINSQVSNHQDGNHPYLLMVFSELGCNTCLDDEAEYANQIALALGAPFVKGIVHARNRRYVQRFIQTNQIRFPVFFDRDGEFFGRNDIHEGPVVFVMSATGSVLQCHYPIPGYPDWSAPFHKFARDYLQEWLKSSSEPDPGR